MFTLSIEHAITDYETWRSAFDRMADSRAMGGVIGHRIRRPVDEPCHLIIDLDFETRERAAAFCQFLTNAVWSNPTASPALAGHPTTRILEPVDQVGMTGLVERPSNPPTAYTGEASTY
jgi:hypothetical protein